MKKLLLPTAYTALFATSYVAAFLAGQQHGRGLVKPVDVLTTREYKECLSTIVRVGKMNATMRRQIEAQK